MAVDSSGKYFISRLSWPLRGATNSRHHCTPRSVYYITLRAAYQHVCKHRFMSSFDDQIMSSVSLRAPLNPILHHYTIRWYWSKLNMLMYALASLTKSNVTDMVIQSMGSLHNQMIINVSLSFKRCVTICYNMYMYITKCHITNVWCH